MNSIIMEAMWRPALLTFFVPALACAGACGSSDSAQTTQSAEPVPRMSILLDAGNKAEPPVTTHEVVDTRDAAVAIDAAVAVAPTLGRAVSASGAALNTRLKTLASGEFYRASVNRLPPWDSVEVANVFGFLKNPGKSTLTVLPIDVSHRPFNLKIVSLTKRTEEKPYWWEVELQKVSDKDLYSMPSPQNLSPTSLGRVAVLYPAQKNAKLLAPASIPIADLPKGIAPATVIFAVDSRGDNRPDAIEQSFCCENESLSGLLGSCDYNCSRTYLRLSGKWKMVNFSQPL